MQQTRSKMPTDEKSWMIWSRTRRRAFAGCMWICKNHQVNMCGRIWIDSTTVYWDYVLLACPHTHTPTHELRVCFFCLSLSLYLSVSLSTHTHSSICLSLSIDINIIHTQWLMTCFVYIYIYTHNRHNICTMYRYKFYTYIYISAHRPVPLDVKSIPCPISSCRCGILTGSSWLVTPLLSMVSNYI